MQAGRLGIVQGNECRPGFARACVPACKLDSAMLIDGMQELACLYCGKREILQAAPDMVYI